MDVSVLLVLFAFIWNFSLQRPQGCRVLATHVVSCGLLFWHCWQPMDVFALGAELPQHVLVALWSSFRPESTCRLAC